MEDALNCLRSDTASSAVEGTLVGDVIDRKSPISMESFFAKAGEIDRLAWPQGDAFALGEDVEESKTEENRLYR